MKNFFKFKELISMQCFKPSLTASSFTLKERCKGKEVVVMSYGKEGFKVGKVSFEKDMQLENVQFFEYKEIDKAWIHMEACSSERIVAVTLGLKVHYAFEKENEIPQEMRGAKVVLEEGCLKGFFRQTDYLLLEKVIADRGFTLIRTQLTTFNLLCAILEEGDLKLDDLICIIDQGFFTGLRLSVGKLRHVPLSEALHENFKEDVYELLGDNFSGKIIFCDTRSSAAKGQLPSCLATYQQSPFQSKILHPLHPELELLIYE